MKESLATCDIADSILKLYNNKDKINKDFWFHNFSSLLYYNEVMDFLLSEGFLKETPYDFEITYKGRLKIDSGGFVGSFRRERSVLRWNRVATIAAIVAALASIAALIVALAD